MDCDLLFSFAKRASLEASPHGSPTRQQSGWHVLAVLDAEREQLWAKALSWQQTGRPPIPNGMWDAADAQAAAHRDANPLAEIISEALG